MKSSRFSVRDRFRSFGFAGQGIYSFLRTEHNAWLHCGATVMVVAAGFWAGLSGTEWIAIIFAISIVWMAEMFNTCIERLMDHLSPEYSQPVKFIKDVSAGAVLVASVAAALIGLLVFIPHISLFFTK